MGKQKSSKAASGSEKDSHNNASKKDLIVVGIGASAGGIKALQEFFETMPPNSGMAFVVILHLSPEHESTLSEIIQARTAMQVSLVEGSLSVEPNCVYVISPNAQLEMVDGVIRSTEATGERGTRVAIDIFYRTLADAYRNSAICIVMSGTGTDGTLGLKAIKEANGFAIVQDPSDATYDSMPRSAISTGIVDWILPVRQMPERLIQFRDSSHLLHLTNEDSDSKIALKIQADKSLRDILTVLRVRTGHDFSNYKTPTLVRRIARHLQIYNLPDIPSYLEFLREKPDEIHFLIKNLLINVTNFFRDQEAWNKLEKDILPGLFANKMIDDTLRVWSCGCASGEEAYSLAMLLIEYSETLRDPPKIQIFATDVDDDAIGEAREHRYPQSIEADVSPARLKRFFVKEGKYYRVKKELREMILFASHNVLRDPPFSRLDLIVCRNLLIYLNRETQERVLEVFHFALARQGYLFLGSSETAEAVPALFSAVDKKQRIYARRRTTFSQPSAPPLMPVAGRWEAKSLPPILKHRERSTMLDELHFKLLESLAPPSILVNQDFDIQYMSETAGRFLHFKSGEPSNNLLRMINTELLPDLRAALFSVQRERKSAHFQNIRATIDGSETNVTIIIRPVDLEGETTDYLLVIFDDNDKPVFRTEPKIEKPVRLLNKDTETEAFVARLEDELILTKEILRATIEQHEVSVEELKASNEELQAINEELRSTTEELETSKEELQSVNEELTTVNQEHRDKIEETMRVISDLQNLMSSTDIATIFLDRQLCIKRFTPPVRRLFNISEFDTGRPLDHFTHKLDYKNLSKDAVQVLKKLAPIEREVRDDENRTFLARLLPYRTIDERIEGVVLNFVDITERKKAEETKCFLGSIVESSDDSIVTVNFDGTITSWNKASELLYGYSAREAVGKPLSMLSLSSNLQTVLDRIDNVKLSRRVEVFDSVRVRKDGHEMNLEIVFSPVNDAAGKVIGVSVIARDVTARRIAVDALSLSESRLQKAISIETVGISFFTIDGTITDANNAFLRMSGYTLEEIRAGTAHWEHITPPEFMEAALKARNELIARGEYTPYEKQFKKPDGAIRWGLFAGKCLNDTDCVEFVVDITESKRAEEEKHRLELRLRQMMESVSDYAIIFTDRKGSVTSWNTGAEKIFGWTEKEVIGSSADIIFTPEDRAHGVPDKERLTALTVGRAEDERFHLHKNGTRFYVSGVMTPLRDDDELEGFVKICRDETAKIVAEQTAQEKAMLRRLVSAQEDERRRIARDIHDHFGQQMTALRLQLDALKKASGSGSGLSKYVEDAEETAAALDASIDFIAWELRPASLDDLGLRATLANFVGEWSKHSGIAAEFHATGLGRTRLEYEIETNLYRIAQEALNNIIKHAGAEKVSVLLEKSRSKVSLIVEDDGVGFNPANKMTRRKGIGLVGMIERAKICGGTLEIESAKGKGTTVFARVPLQN